MLNPRHISPLLAVTLSLLFLGNVTANAADKYPGTADGAKALLSEFLKPGADLAALSKQLQPTPADYEAAYEASFAKQLQDMYTPVWASGKLVLAPQPGQTELLLDAVPTSEVRQWNAHATAVLPGGYQKVSSFIKEGNTIYRFKFVKPGEQMGMAFDGLTYVNSHWCIIPKPWRATEAAK